MDTLILKKTASVYGLGSNDDYVVLDADQVVGRVMLWPRGDRGFGRSQLAFIRLGSIVAGFQRHASKR